MKRHAILVAFIANVLLWTAGFFIFKHQQRSRRPAALLERLQEDVRRKQRAVETFRADTVLMNSLWEPRMAENTFDALSRRSIAVQVFDSGKMVFWSHNDFVLENCFSSDWTCRIENGDIFIFKTFSNPAFPARRINFVIPVRKRYAVTNQYLRSFFFASSFIPDSTKISLTPIAGGRAIVGNNGKTAFYAHIAESDIKPFVPGIDFLLYLTLCCFAALILVNLLVGLVYRRKSLGAALACLAAFLALVELLVHVFGPPFCLQNLELFSPRVFASSSFLPSLGHLLMHVIFIYWIISYANGKLRHLHRRTIVVHDVIARWSFFTLAVFGVITLGFYMQHLLQALVFDSDISFNTDNYRNADKYTLLSVLLIVLIARAMMHVLHITNAFLNGICPDRYLKYLVVALICLIHLFVGRVVLSQIFSATPQNTLTNWMDVCAIVWMVSYLYLTDTKLFRKYFGQFDLFTAVFRSAYFALLFSAFFKFYLDEKEKTSTRMAFAEKLSRVQDTEFEVRFDELGKQLAADTVIRNWMQHRDSVGISDVYNHFKMLHADFYFDKYAHEVGLFDTAGNSIIAEPTITFSRIKALARKGAPTLNPYLFFVVDSFDQGRYVAALPVAKGDTALGYIGVYVKLKQNISPAVYPLLLKDQADYYTAEEPSYDYAIYTNGKLTSRFGSYNFENEIKLPPEAPYVFFTAAGAKSKLYYRTNASTLYVVVKDRNQGWGFLTIFSAVFCLFFAGTAFESRLMRFLYTRALYGRRAITRDKGMSTRIKSFAFMFTAISFFAIGTATILFLTQRYQDSIFDNLKRNTTNASEAVTDYMQSRKIVARKGEVGNEIARRPELAYFLTGLSRQQKLDLNIFEIGGRLAFTSQMQIFDKRIMSPRMPASAFYNFKRERLTEYIQRENIGGLTYYAAYSVLYDQEGEPIGFLNIPAFDAKRQLDREIIGLVLTLVNIYTILLLISGVVTFLFVDRLTRSLRLVADSLKNVNLKNNDLIHWPYEDEIGLLVHEYNKMVATVEEHARSLVLDERQNAWREMAQQVAHEIKNPLTPMKLNIQYLQQAINNNNPDIIELTKRVSTSLIEQIDNLNYIASEFSNFAKMPENKTERIDVKNMLESIILLNEGNENLRIRYEFPEVPVIVFGDKSQMMRIFNNIVQNAAEAMLPPEERTGEIDINVSFSGTLDAVVVTVTDNGTGIPDAVKDKIFDPYFTTKNSGTGLGLAMTKKIIELWGGSIRFISQKDAGTTFYITLPLG